MTGTSAVRPFDAIALGTDIQRRLGVKTSPADLFAVAHNAFELKGLVKFARTRGIPHVVLGRGSDVVISDAGVRGLVIQVRAEGSEIRDDRLVAEAGLPMARAATDSQRAGLTGLEFGLAIPGTAGGAVWANAGAHEADVAGVLESALILGADGRESRQTPADLGLAYRHSRLKDPVVAGAEPEIVISATFQLAAAEAETIKERLEEIKHWRQAHQYSVRQHHRRAASFFRNPPGDRSAGALIDEAGLKGRRVGGASVSPKHANFLVNDGRGTAADVRHLGDQVRAIVAERFGIALVPEVVFLGDWSAWDEVAP